MYPGTVAIPCATAASHIQVRKRIVLLRVYNHDVCLALFGHSSSHKVKLIRFLPGFKSPREWQTLAIAIEYIPELELFKYDSGYNQISLRTLLMLGKYIGHKPIIPDRFKPRRGLLLCYIHAFVFRIIHHDLD